MRYYSFIFINNIILIIFHCSYYIADQIDRVQPGKTVILRNAKIDMFKGFMRLAVDKWGKIDSTENATFEVNSENNLSKVEYELVTVDNE